VIEPVSGYDPETGICWQFHNKGDQSWRCKCPVCSDGCRDHYDWTWFGRCRSGKRWFWAASLNISDKKRHGWANTEELATAAAMAAVRDFRAAISKPLKAIFVQQTASWTLKELNKAKRAAQPASGATDSKRVEYLYGYSGYSRGLSRFQIVKKTKKRIYYLRLGESIDEFGESDPNPYFQQSGERNGDRASN
jgi:hypothetical protein